MQAAKSADMGLRYDPMTADKEFQSRTLDVWRRDLQISVPLTLFLGQVLIDFQRGVEKGGVWAIRDDPVQLVQPGALAESNEALAHPAAKQSPEMFGRNACLMRDIWQG